MTRRLATDEDYASSAGNRPGGPVANDLIRVCADAVFHAGVLRPVIAGWCETIDARGAQRTAQLDLDLDEN